MFRKNELKKIVLQCVRDKGRASSKQVWTKLWPFRVSHKNVSMTLLKCKRQKLLERTQKKHGRVREYFYTITKRGRKRLIYYTAKEREVNCGVVEIEELVEDARKEITPLYACSVGIFNHAEKLCNNTLRADVFSIGTQCATMSTYLIMNKHELIAAFAAKKLLSLISPETSASIKNALAAPSIENRVDLMQMFSVVSRLNRLSKPFQPRAAQWPSLEDFLKLLTLKRMRELHADQWLLGCMLREEKGAKDMYRSLYEMERTYRIKLEEKLAGSYANFGALASLTGEFLKMHRTTMGYMLKTDLQIIKHLAKRATRRESSDVLWITHCYIECLEENRKLADDNRRLGEKVERCEEEIYSLQDHVLRDPSIPISAC